MSVIIPKSWSAFFNSDPLSGSTNLSEDGDKFSITLNTPLKLPPSTIAVRMGVVSASIWNTSFNCSAGFYNNLFSFTVSGASRTITIPNGLYSLSDLQTYLNNQFVLLGLPANLFILTANTPTQQCVITYLNNSLSLDFTFNSVGSLLGFDSQAYPYPVNGILYSPNVAKLNRNNSYLIRTNMISNGVPINSNAQGIIASIPIPAGSVNSIISYAPNQILWFDASELIGSPKMNFSFQLTNENLQITPTNGDYWSFTVLIEYSVLMTNQDVPLRP